LLHRLRLQRAPCFAEPPATETDYHAQNTNGSADDSDNRYSSQKKC
jgi:hypothetical protein